MTEAIKTKEKNSSFRELFDNFKAKTAEKIKKILSFEKPEGRNQFYKEYKKWYSQLDLEEQLGIYYTLENFLNTRAGDPYEELTESIKPFLEDDESLEAERVLDLIVNEDIFKEDGYEFWYCMRKCIANTSEHYTKDEIETKKQRALQKFRRICK